MPGILYKFFPKEENDKYYTTHEEYYRDLAKLVEMVFSYYVEVAENRNNYIRRKTARSIKLYGIGESAEYKRQKEICESDYSDAMNIINMKKGKLKKKTRSKALQTAFDYVGEVFNFNKIETFCFMLAFVLENYEKFKLFLPTLSALAGQRLSYDLAIELYNFVSHKQSKKPLTRKKGLMKKMSLLVFADGEEIIIDEMVNNFVVTNGKSYGNNAFMDIFFPPDKVKPLPVMNEIAEKIYAFSQKTHRNEAVFYYLSGKKTMGKTTQVKQFSALSGQPIVFMDLSLLQFKQLEKITISVCRVAMLNRAALCVKNVHILQENFREDEKKFSQTQIDEKLIYLMNMINKIAIYMDSVFLLSEYDKYNTAIKDGRYWVDIPLRMPNFQESIRLWNRVLLNVKLEKRTTGKELAYKFQFTPGQIQDTMSEAIRMNIWKAAPLTNQEFNSCVYKQVSHSLDKKATLVHAKHTWDRLILPEREKRMLRNACNQMKYKSIVYDDWGMADRVTYGQGISMLFEGPPGTGKTMGAHVVANELGIEMYKVNLSQVVSKYIGETEKNLNDIFREAQKTSVILFFDETDAILGKRTEVKESKDKNANMETSFLLQKMEEYNGITVMTTNYIENIDNAFFRRISYVIHFPFPNEEDRKKIWINMIPDKMPVSDDIDFDYLASQFEIAGGNIKNTVVAAAFMAASNNEALDMQHIVLALKYEMSKQGKNMLKEDFGEYGFYLDDFYADS